MNGKRETREKEKDPGTHVLLLSLSRRKAMTASVSIQTFGRLYEKLIKMNGPEIVNDNLSEL